MFLPGRSVEQERAAKQAAFRHVEDLCAGLLPNQPQLRQACTVSVQEVQCGDPQCSPIDTIITLTFESGGQGMFGVPLEAKDVQAEHLEEVFPSVEVIEKWFRGEEAEWPPEPEPVELRFQVGTAVLCRVGPAEWASGTVAQLWYRENQWPPGTYAPYRIRLDDGRNIFAPQDIDQIIKLNPSALRLEGS